MAVDFRVVIPDDMGNSIKLGALVEGKYDVDLTQLALPPSLTSLTLEGTTLTAAMSSGGDKTVDLSSMLPEVVADVFLKGVARNGDKLVFTVGASDNADNDTTLEVAVADLLPVEADEETITGTGVSGSPLKLKLSTSTENNLLKRGADGLYVSPADIPVPPVQPREIRLTNASGATLVGYIYSQEQ